MSRLSLRLGAVALALLVSSCDSTEEAFSRVDLRVGQTLEYTTRYTENGLYEGTEALDITGQIVQRVTSTGQTLEGRGGLTRVEVESTERDRPDLVFRSTIWYRPTDARLEEVAYQFSGDGPSAVGLRGRVMDPTLPRTVNRLIEGAQRSGGDGPECPFNCAVTFRAPARIVVEYPGYTGQTWTHFNVESSLSSTREIIANETIETPAGTFPCVVVRTRLLGFGDDFDFNWIDWISDVGLVRRRIVSRTPLPLADGTTVDAIYTESVDLAAVRR